MSFLISVIAFIYYFLMGITRKNNAKELFGIFLALVSFSLLFDYVFRNDYLISLNLFENQNTSFSLIVLFLMLVVSVVQVFELKRSKSFEAFAFYNIFLIILALNNIYNPLIPLLIGCEVVMLSVFNKLNGSLFELLLCSTALTLLGLANSYVNISIVFLFVVTLSNFSKKQINGEKEYSLVLKILFSSILFLIVKKVGFQAIEQYWPALLAVYSLSILKNFTKKNEINLGNLLPIFAGIFSPMAFVCLQLINSVEDLINDKVYKISISFILLFFIATKKEIIYENGYGYVIVLILAFFGLLMSKKDFNDA